jgi:hypothetical protein
MWGREDLDLSNNEIQGSNPTRGMDELVSFYIYVFFDLR